MISPRVRLFGSRFRQPSVNGPFPRTPVTASVFTRDFAFHNQSIRHRFRNLEINRQSLGAQGITHHRVCLRSLSSHRPRSKLCQAYTIQAQILQLFTVDFSRAQERRELELANITGIPDKNSKAMEWGKIRSPLESWCRGRESKKKAISGWRSAVSLEGKRRKQGSAIQVGTANFVDPESSVKIVDGLRAYCQENNIADVNSLIGTLQLPD